MRTDWMKKLQNPEGGTALLLEFLAALLMVQGLAGIRSLDFWFVLPWLLLLLFMANREVFPSCLRETFCC